MPLWNEVLRGQKSTYKSDEDEDEDSYDDTLEEDVYTGEDVYANEADLDEVGKEVDVFSEYNTYLDYDDISIYCPECGDEIDGTRCDTCGKIVLL